MTGVMVNGLSDHGAGGVQPGVVSGEGVYLMLEVVVTFLFLLE